ncbi:MAG: peptidoglycan-binding domain-containing protein [Polyangiales bacterium]
MRPHVVRTGDTLGRIARAAGQPPEVIWDHPRNADLRARRAHPEVLAPGDVIHVPTTPPPGLPLKQGADNGFVATLPRVHVRVVLREDGTALANEEVVLLGAGDARALTSDGEGVVEVEVPEGAAQVELVLLNRGVSIPVAVGHLDPVETASGLRQRLSHLRHLADGEDLATGVASFQRAAGLSPTGVADDATRDALARAHGG